MNLNNQQLDVIQRKRGTFEGQIDEVSAIEFAEVSRDNALTFAMEAFMDQSINNGVIIGGGASLAITVTDDHEVEISRGYGLSRDAKPVVIPLPANLLSFQGNSAQGNNRYLLTGNTDFDHNGGLPSGTNDLYLSIAYKEHTETIGVAVADFIPKDIHKFHNWFLRIGIDAPTEVGGTGPDTSALGSDGTVGSNADDIFVAKVSYNKTTGAITPDVTFLRILITSEISSASESVFVGHKRQSHVSGIIPLYADRVDIDWGENGVSPAPVNDTLKPSVNGAIDNQVDFLPYKTGTLVVIKGDEIAEPTTLTFDVTTGSATLVDGNDFFVVLKDDGTFDTFDPAVGVNAHSQAPENLLVLAKFQWEATGSIITFPIPDPLVGTKGIHDLREFGTNDLKRWKWSHKYQAVVFDVGLWGSVNSHRWWVRGNNDFSIEFGDDTPEKRLFLFDTDDDTFILGESTFRVETSKFKITSDLFWQGTGLIEADVVVADGGSFTFKGDAGGTVGIFANSAVTDPLFSGLWNAFGAVMFGLTVEDMVITSATVSGSGALGIASGGNVLFNSGAFLFLKSGSQNFIEPGAQLFVNEILGSTNNVDLTKFNSTNINISYQSKDASKLHYHGNDNFWFPQWMGMIHRQSKDGGGAVTRKVTTLSSISASDVGQFGFVDDNATGSLAIFSQIIQKGVFNKLNFRINVAKTSTVATKEGSTNQASLQVRPIDPKAVLANFTFGDDDNPGLQFVTETFDATAFDVWQLKTFAIDLSALADTAFVVVEVRIEQALIPTANSKVNENLIGGLSLQRID